MSDILSKQFDTLYITHQDGRSFRYIVEFEEGVIVESFSERPEVEHNNITMKTVYHQFIGTLDTARLLWNARRNMGYTTNIKDKHES